MLFTVPRCKADSQEQQPSPLLKSCDRGVQVALPVKLVKLVKDEAVPRHRLHPAVTGMPCWEADTSRWCSLLSPPGELPYLFPASPLTPCSFHTLPHPSICTKFQLLPLSFFHILPILSPPLPFSVKGETASMEGGEHVTSFQEAECLLYPYCPSLS